MAFNTGGAGGHITEDKGSEKRNGDNRESRAGEHELDGRAGRVVKSKLEGERSRSTAEMEAGSEEAGGEAKSGL